MRRALLFVMAAVVLSLTAAAFASEVHPLLPAGKSKIASPQDPLDTIYPYQHVDENAEFYLGSGAADDTFFIVFEPPVPCSVKYVEMQWYDGGNINAFAAWYSDDAIAMYPGGDAPARGQSPVSPVGTWIAGPVPNTAAATGDWELLDLGGTEFVCGNPGTMEPGMFGVGFIKGAAEPHPLADQMDAKGVRYTYSWFGGPWMATYPNPWGAYSGNLISGTVVDVMMRVWVSYPWGMPILITNLFQKSDTYSTAGPYTITVNLEDDGQGITAADDIELVYEVDDVEYRVDLTETAPGSGLFTANIPGQALGSQIYYWIECTDDAGFESATLPLTFFVLEPMRPDADLLFVDDGTDDRIYAYTWAFDQLGIWAEVWTVDEHLGIDASVIEAGWGTVLVSGWGVATVPALDDANAYSDFLDDGGNLAVFDQDYFYANNLPAQGVFAAGDFAYDYLGVNEYYNDIGDADMNYLGVGGGIGNDWEAEPYVTYWDSANGAHMYESQFWADYFIEGAAENVFFGETDGNSYGCSYDNGTFKTVFLSFMPEANCSYIEYYEEGLTMTPTDDLKALLTNVFDFFGTVDVNAPAELSPVIYDLKQNYPNPFNPTTSISFALPLAGQVSLKVFNVMGQEVATAYDGMLNSGVHNVNFDASKLSSGVYIYQLKAGDYTASKTMTLVK